MKKQLIFVLALSTLFLAACAEEMLYPLASDAAVTPKVKMTSFYPEEAAIGTAVTLFGENFSLSLADNYVTFDSVRAEVIQAQTGTVVVRIPDTLAPGDYTISLLVHEQWVSSAKAIKVVDPRL